MAPSLVLGSSVIDYGLDTFSLANKIVICSQQPTSYDEANTYTLGSKSFGVGNAMGAISDYASGRKIPSTAITDGSVASDGTATHWAVLDDANSRLLATGPLA